MSTSLHLDSRFRDAERWPHFGDYGINLLPPAVDPLAPPPVQGAPLYPEWAAMPVTVDPDLATVDTHTISVEGGTVVDAWTGPLSLPTTGSQPPASTVHLLAVRASKVCRIVSLPANVPAAECAPVYTHSTSASAGVLFVALVRAEGEVAWRWLYTLSADALGVPHGALVYRPERAEVVASCVLDVDAGTSHITWLLARPGPPREASVQGTTALDHASSSLQVLATIRFDLATGAWIRSRPSLSYCGLHRFLTTDEFARTLLDMDVAGHLYQAGSWDPLAGALTTAAHYAVSEPDTSPVVPGPDYYDPARTTTVMRVAHFQGDTYLWVTNATRLQLFVATNITAPRSVYTFDWPEETYVWAEATSETEQSQAPAYDVLESPVDVMVSGAVVWCVFQNGFVWQFNLALSPALGLAVTPRAALPAFAAPGELLVSATQPHRQDPGRAFWPADSPRQVWFWLTTQNVYGGAGSSTAATKTTFRIRTLAADARHGGFLVPAASAPFVAAAVKFAFPGLYIPIMAASWPSAAFTGPAGGSGGEFSTRAGLLAATHIVYPYECALTYTDPVATTVPAVGQLFPQVVLPPAGAQFVADTAGGAGGGGIATVTTGPDEVRGAYRVTGYMDSAAATYQNASPNPYHPTYRLVTAVQSRRFEIDGWDLYGDSGYAADPTALTVDVGGETVQGPWTQIQFPSAFVLDAYTVSVLLQPTPTDPLGGSFGFTPYVAPRRIVTLGSNDGFNWTTVDDFSPTAESWAEAAGQGALVAANLAVATLTRPLSWGSASASTLAQTSAFRSYRQVWLAATSFADHPEFDPDNDPNTYWDQTTSVTFAAPGLTLAARPSAVTPAATTVAPPSVATAWSVPVPPVVFPNLIVDIAVATDAATQTTLAAVSTQTGAFVNTAETNTVPTRESAGFQLYDVTSSGGKMRFVRGSAWAVTPQERQASNYVQALAWTRDLDGRWYIRVVQRTSTQWVPFGGATDWTAAVLRRPLLFGAAVQTTRVLAPDESAIQSVEVAALPVSWLPTSSSDSSASASASANTRPLASVSFVVTPTYWSPVVNAPSPACSVLDSFLPGTEALQTTLGLPGGPSGMFPAGLLSVVHPDLDEAYVLALERAATVQLSLLDVRQPSYTRAVAALDVDPSLFDAQTAWVPVPSSSSSSSSVATQGARAGLGIFGIAQPDGYNYTLQWWDATQTLADLREGSATPPAPTFAAQCNLGWYMSAAMCVLCQASALPGVAADQALAGFLAAQVPIIVVDQYYCISNLFVANQQPYPTIASVAVSAPIFAGDSEYVMQPAADGAELELKLELEPVLGATTVTQSVPIPRHGSVLFLGQGYALAPDGETSHQTMYWQVQKVEYDATSSSWRIRSSDAYGYDLGLESGGVMLDMPRSPSNFYTSGPGSLDSGADITSWLWPAYYSGTNDPSSSSSDGKGTGLYPNPARCQVVAHPDGGPATILSVLNFGVWYVWMWDGEVQSAPVLWSATTVGDPDVLRLDLVAAPAPTSSAAVISLGVLVTFASPSRPARWVPPPPAAPTGGELPGYAGLAEASVDPFTPVVAQDWWGLGAALAQVQLQLQSSLEFPHLLPAPRSPPAWTCTVDNAAAFRRGGARAFFSVWAAAFPRASLELGPDPKTGATSVLNKSLLAPCLGMYDAAARGGLDSAPVPFLRRSTVAVPPPPSPNSAWAMSTNGQGRAVWAVALADEGLPGGSLGDRVMLGGMSIDPTLTCMALSGSSGGGGGLRSFAYPVDSATGAVGLCSPTPAWAYGGNSATGAQARYGAWVVGLVPATGVQAGSGWFVLAAGFGAEDSVHARQVRWDSVGEHLFVAQTVGRACSNVAVYQPRTPVELAGTISSVVGTPSEGRTGQVAILSRAGQCRGVVTWSGLGGEDVDVCGVAVDRAGESSDWWATGWSRAQTAEVVLVVAGRPDAPVQAVRCARPAVGGAWFAYRFGAPPPPLARGGSGATVTEDMYRSSSVTQSARDVAGTNPLVAVDAAGGAWWMYCDSPAAQPGVRAWAEEPDGCTALVWDLDVGASTAASWATVRSLARTGGAGQLSSLVVPGSLPPSLPWGAVAPPLSPSTWQVAASLRTEGVTDAYVFVLGAQADAQLNRSWRVRAGSGPTSDGAGGQRAVLRLNGRADTRKLDRVFEWTGLGAPSHLVAHISRSQVQGAARVHISSEPAGRWRAAVGAVYGACGVGLLSPLYAVPASGPGSLPGVLPGTPSSESSGAVEVWALPASGQLGRKAGDTWAVVPAHAPAGQQAVPVQDQVWWVAAFNESKRFYFAFNPAPYASVANVSVHVVGAVLPNVDYMDPTSTTGGVLRLAGLPYAYLQVFPTSADGTAGTGVLNNFVSNNGALNTAVLTYMLVLSGNCDGPGRFITVTSPLPVGPQTVQFEPDLTSLRIRLLDPMLRPIVFDCTAPEDQLATQFMLRCEPAAL